MATKKWVGGAGAVSQVATATFATYDASTTRKITIGGITFGLLDSGGNLTAALAAFATYLNSSSVGAPSAHPYFAAITWSSTATTIRGDADTPGTPFTFAGSVSGGTGTVSNAYTVVTANGGPNDFSTVANWDTNAVPSSGDSLIFDGTSDYALSYGLNTGIYFNLRIDQPNTSVIGLGRSFTTDVVGSTLATPEVPEYRPQYLAMTSAADAVACDIGREFGPSVSAGSGRIKIDFGGSTPTIQLFNSCATSLDDGLMPIQFLFSTNPYGTIYLRSAMINIGAQSETCNLLEINVADTSSFSRVVMGPNVSCPTFKCNGGRHTIQTVASLSITNNGGIIDVEGNTTIVTNSVNQGTTYVNGAVTVTTSAVKGGAILNCRKSGRAVTLTNIALSRGAIFQSGPNVTHSNPPTYPDGPYQVQVQ